MEDLLYVIALTLVENLGPIRCRRLIDYYGSAKEIFNQGNIDYENVGIKGRRIDISRIKYEVLKKAEEEISYINANNIIALKYDDSEYPYRLKECVDAPIVIYCMGNTDLNSDRQIAVVGTRNPSIEGKEATRMIIEDLAINKVLVISGLAYGIDTEAHKSALNNNLLTVAVVGHGLSIIYPAENRKLAEKIIDSGGCIISEYISSTGIDKGNFPARNRIIAGLSDCVLVVESKKKGGALITAEVANSYNREVFAMPGKYIDRLYEGCNNLIKANKAHLVTEALDIAKIMGWEEVVKDSYLQVKLFEDIDSEEKQIVEILSEVNTISIDDLADKCNLSTGTIANLILELELKGIVKVLPGNIYRLNIRV